MIGETIRRLCALAILFGAALSITPKGGIKRITQILCAAVLVSVVLLPLREFDFEEYSLRLAEYKDMEAELLQNGDDVRDGLNRTVIERECEAYIKDKAQDLGIYLADVSVEMQWDMEGLWVPYSAELKCGRSPNGNSALSSVMEAELGIPKDRQHWSSVGDDQRKSGEAS